MADKTDIWEQNVKGSFYVDRQCIACDACVVEAPEFFEMNDIDGHAYVKKQPQTPHELELCQNALDSCPVDAIGKNGNGSN